MPEYIGDKHVRVTVHPAGSIGYAAAGEGSPHVRVTIHPLGHLSIGDSQLRVPTQTFGVFVRQPWSPRQRIAEVTTARVEGVSFERMGIGEAVVAVSLSERALPLLQEGYILEIQDPEQPPWCGLIQRPSRNISGNVEIRALGYASMLDSRAAPLSESYEDPVGSGQVVRSLLSTLNIGGNTGIFPGRIDAGPSLKTLDVGGQQILDALDELASRCPGWEWSLRLEAGAGGFMAFLDWQFHPGFDLSSFVHLWDDIHFQSLEHVSNLSSAIQAVTAVGAFGTRLRNRPSVTRSAAYAASRRTMASGEIQPASETAFLRVNDLPPGIRVERVQHVSMTEDPGELEREAQEALETPQDAIETYVGLVNTAISWSPLVVGNYITLHYGSAAKKVRIIGTNPSRSTGLCEVYFEVPLR